MKSDINTTKHNETLKKQKNESKLKIGKINEKIEKELEEYMMKRKTRKIEREKEK
jgi:hypothetical protein